MKDTEKLVMKQFQRVHDEMDRIFDSFMPGPQLSGRHQCVWRPPTDVYETSDAAVVKVEIAGVREEDFEISFADNVLTVAGVRHEQQNEQRAYQQMEIWRGSFCTEAYVPWRVNTDNIEAHYSDGFLIIRLPKADRQATQIPIRASEGQ